MNRYPMKTTIDGRVVRNCRLIDEGPTTTVWHWDRDAGTAVILCESPEPPERIGATQRWQVDGFVFEPQRGCGCQHPMYTFVPPAGP